MLANKNDDHFIFKMYDKQSITQFRHNELAKIRKTYNRIGMDECYEASGRHKFNLHSWRKRCATEYARKNGEALAHGYIRHRKYLGMYIVKSKEERIDYFKKAMMDLVIDPTEKQKLEIQSLEKDKFKLEKKNAELMEMQLDMNKIKQRLGITEQYVKV